MIFSSRAQIALVPFILLFQTVFTAAPTSFCKCTCFSNSTIIPLEAPITVTPKMPSLLFARSPDESKEEDGKESDPPEPDDDDGGKKDDKQDEDGQAKKEYRSKNCNDCNRQFCIELNLPICKGAAMDDVFTTCFQRDSRKDEAVVFIFIIATAGLLAWAALKPWVGKWVATARERRSYMPVSGGEN